jgi:hypothetical protein
MEYTIDVIADKLKEKLKLFSRWSRTLFFGVYEAIIQAISYAINRKAVYPAEVFYRESFIKTATKYSSVLPRAEYLSYTPHRKRGASGTLKLSADPNFSDTYTYTGESVIIPRWTAFVDNTGNANVYSTEEAIYYNGTEGNLEIPIKEGLYKEYVYTAEGLENEVVTLFSDTSDNEEFTVHIVDSNNVILFDVLVCGIDIPENKLFFVNDLDNYVCQVDNAYDFLSVNFTFGDGITTKKLNSGDRVLIKFADTKGVEGNITNSATITKIKEPLYDALEQEATLYVTHDEEISDGSDVEELESIKENSTNLFGTGQRCGSYDDWIYILENHPYISKAIIWTIDDVADETYTTDQNKIFVSAISQDGDALTLDQQNEITIDYLKVDKKSPTERVQWEPLKIVYAKFDVEAVVQNQSFLVVEGQINEKLKENYYILNTTFKQNIYDSNFTRIIDNLDSVVRHVTSLEHMEKGFAYYVSEHELYPSWTSANTSIEENQVFLLEDSLKIWVRRKNGGSELGEPVLVGFDENNIIKANDNTYVDVSLGENKKINSSTGLANDSTIYTATIEINDFGAQTISVVGSQAQTMSDLIDQIKADVSDINLTFDNNTDFIRFGVDISGQSTVTLIDGNLFSSLFGGSGVSIGDPNDGFKYTITGGNLNYETNIVSFVVNDLSAIAPEDFELSISYKTKDGNGEQINDIRLKRFNIITSVDEVYNTFELRYE